MNNEPTTNYSIKSPSKSHQRVGKESLNDIKLKKNSDLFFEKKELSIFKEKTDAIKIKLTQPEKTGSIGKIFICLENLIPLLRLQVDHVFRDVYAFAVQ